VAQRLVENGVAPEAGLKARLLKEREQAEAFLHATDIEENFRARTRRLRAGLLFVEAYRDLPLLAWPRRLVDAVVEVEEQFVLWRHRHARMTERTIGRRTGTGGSSGVDYLDQAARVRVYPELWAVRTLLLPREALPRLRNPEFYGFAA
jgi:tryptophan 2,3-dioxygenase